MSSTSTDPPVSLSLQGIAAAFDVSTRTVQRWVGEGFPRWGEGRSATYPLRECIAFVLARERAEVDRLLASFEDENASRAKKLAMQARLLEIEVDEKEARLISIDDLEELHAKPLSELRGALLAMPGQLAPLLDRYRVQEAIAILEKFIFNYMSRLATMMDSDAEDAESEG